MRAPFLLAAMAFLAVSTPAAAQSPQPLPIPIMKCVNADLEVRLNFAKMSSVAPHTYRVQIMGIVRNTSTTRTFDPPPGHAFGRLYEILPGQRPKLVSEIPVGRLGPGGVSSNNLKIYKDWDVQGPFAKAAPNYRVIFEHDAQVQECNPANNTAEIQGSAIQAALLPP